MASHTYEVDVFHRGLPVVLGTAVGVASVAVLATGEPGGWLLLVLGGWAAFQFGLWAPHRVTLDDSGVLL